MRSNFYQGAQGIFLVFDMTRFKTFNNIYNWHKDIKKNLKESFKTIGFIIGNKRDLTETRAIADDAGDQLAKELGLEYIETSALTGENVDYAFRKIAETLLEILLSTSFCVKLLFILYFKHQICN